jgi:hypothetical protein
LISAHCGHLDVVKALFEAGGRAADAFLFLKEQIKDNIT